MDKLDALSFDFFRLFSRFEYSLKATRFCKEDKVEADWKKFAEDIHEGFQDLKRETLVEATKYILANPPKKQVIKQGGIAWSDSSPASVNDTDLLLLYVRRVRNNLFHGGKFNGNRLAPQRSEQLLNSSIIVLECALDINNDVKQAFEN